MSSPFFAKLVQGIREYAATAWSGVRWFSKHTIGQWDWEPPAWLAWISARIRALGQRLRSDWRLTLGLAVAFLAILAGGYWYRHRPRPHYVTFQVTAPGLTEWDANGRKPPKPLMVDFAESAAPLQQIEKPVATGITLSPRVAGTWFWVSDKKLRFTPKDDWPIGQEFSARIAKNGVLARQAVLEDYGFSFKSAPFVAKIASAEFYQDPRDPTLKKIVTTVDFSHPVDTERFEKAIQLGVEADAQYLGLKSDSRNFTVVYDKFRLSASIHSVPLAMPRDDTPLTVQIKSGVRAARGGNETGAPLRAAVVIPGRGSLQFSSIQMTIADNDRYEPEQILIMRTSSPVAERAVTGKVSAWVLPVRSPQQPKDDKEPWEWNSSEAGEDIIKKSEPLKLTYQPSEAPGNLTHGFKFLAPVGRFVFVEVKEGVEGIGGYVSSKPFTAVFQVRPYPKALTFLGQGALLPLGGDKKVGFLVRGVGRVEIEVGRVLPNQIQHLAEIMWNYAKPNVYEGLANKIVERWTVTRNYPANNAGKPTWDSLDLSPYLRAQNGGTRGLFLLHIREPRKQAQPRRAQADADEDADGGDGEDGENGGGPESRGPAEDSRLILVTDLGLIVKRNKDDSREVFVQSIRTGAPADGTKVALLGSNGEPVTTVTTDATGHAALPKPSTDWKREKTPETILAQRGDDYSFLPLRANGRELDFSRFDIGGAVNNKSAQDLSAYLFTDRGIYRPGETVHLGVIIRTGDWKASLAGLPVKVEISDSRGTVVSRNELKLSAAAFESIDWTSAAGAPTGTYEATAFLVKGPDKDELLGTTSFRVQEFEPDRMKVRLDLSGKSGLAWLRPAEVSPKVAAALLSGEPAGGRRVEGEISLTPVFPAFSKYPDHRFQVAEFKSEPYRETVAAQTTDAQGNATLPLDLTRFAGRAYRLNVLARVFEAGGGRNVAAQNSAIVSDSPWLVGVKGDGDLSFVRRDSAHTANWLAVDQTLAPVAVDGLTLEWVQRKYVSVLTEQGNKTFQYVSRLQEVVRDSRKVSIARGGSNFPLRTSEPGDFVMVLRDASGAEVNKISYSVAGDANLSRSLERNAELEIQLNKKEYSAGETIDVSIRAPYVGAGLITIERDKVYAHQWFKTSTNSSVQHIRVPADFEGGGYVTVQYARDPASEDIFLSPLSYGAAPFSGNLTARTLPLTLTAPKEMKPGNTLTMRVVPGAAARVAVFAVDEGILQVARYRNPDPVGYFFQKKMLEVETTQILDLILPEFKRFLALAAPGGDADGGYARHLNPFQRKRKPPVAWWSGIVDVGAAGRNFSFTVPDYFNGHIRIVAIAVNASRIGVQEAGTDVRGDFILTPNVPAVVGPGDEFIVSSGVLDNVPGGKGPIHIEASVGPELTPLGPSALDLDPAGKKEVTAEFRFRANAIPGSASIHLTARRGNAVAKTEETTGIRPPVPYRTQLTLGRLDAAQTQVPLARDLYPQQRTVEAAISGVPLVWGQGLVVWLDNYPYLCTEQLASKGFGALMMTSHRELGTLRGPAQAAADQLVANTISALGGRQNGSGGLGLWASVPDTAEFPTLYAAHFLIEAKEHQQRVPQDLLNRLNEWMWRFASTPAPSLDAGRMRAYAVYLLARQGLRPSAAISNVEQELSNRYPKEWQTDLAAAYLASTYRLMQRNADAEKILSKVPWADQKTAWTGFDYYGGTVHNAQLLYLEARHFPARLTAVPRAVLDDIAKVAGASRFSSLEAANMLLALEAYARSANGSTKLAIAEIGKDGKPKPLALPANLLPKVAISENAAKIGFGKDGPVSAYYSLSESGFDKNPPLNAIQQGAEIIHDFVDAAGNTIPRAKTGEEFFVRIRVRTLGRDRATVAVVDMLPGGIEPVLEIRPQADSTTPGEDPAASRTAQTAPRMLPIGITEKSTWNADHVDVRDDRVILYGTITKDVATFVYRVRATNAGTFLTPPAFAEGMYDRSVSAQSLGGKLEIVKP